MACTKADGSGHKSFATAEIKDRFPIGKNKPLHTLAMGCSSCTCSSVGTAVIHNYVNNAASSGAPQFVKDHTIAFDSIHAEWQDSWAKPIQKSKKLA